MTVQQAPAPRQEPALRAPIPALSRHLGSALGLLLLATSAWASEFPDYVYLAELLRQSTEIRLWEERYWHILLHYRRNVWGGYTSEADDPDFFLAPTGKFDPRAELEATLTHLFSSDLVGRSRQPAQCAFPGRYHWLKEKLAIDETRLPSLPCERLRTWLAELNPQSVTLIFPSAFMNNPASMFGHTLLRIDQKGQTEQTRILAYTINFAAEVTSSNPIAFAVFGVTGGFKGHFSILPYYLKVLEYRDLENRDIWEYRLSLTESQITRMLRHAWELTNAYFDYFFFKENCAYQLLALLESADPDLHLTDRFVFWTIPADAIRVVAEQPGLVRDIAYRPARSTVIRRKAATLSADERRWLRRIVADTQALASEEFARLPADRRALVLDTASDYLLYRSVTDVDRTTLYKDRNREVLTTRSGLRVQSPVFTVPPFTTPPEQGHKTSRAGVAVGWRNDELFEELNVRAGYHDLLDPQTGYTPDAQIEVLGFSIRHYERRDQVRLERFTLANILSLSPIDSLFQAPSWKISAGMQTLSRPDCRLCSNGNLNGGIGAAFETLFWRREVYFAFAELDANYGPAFEERHRVGGGGTIGLLADLTDRWRLLASSTYLRFPLGERSEDIRVSVGQRYTVQRNLALRLEFNHRNHDDELLFTVHAYF